MATPNKTKPNRANDEESVGCGQRFISLAVGAAALVAVRAAEYGDITNGAEGNSGQCVGKSPIEQVVVRGGDVPGQKRRKAAEVHAAGNAKGVSIFESFCLSSLLYTPRNGDFHNGGVLNVHLASLPRFACYRPQEKLVAFAAEGGL